VSPRRQTPQMTVPLIVVTTTVTETAAMPDGTDSTAKATNAPTTSANTSHCSGVSATTPPLARTGLNCWGALVSRFLLVGHFSVESKYSCPAGLGSLWGPRSLRAGPESPRSAALRRFRQNRSSIVGPESPRPVADTSLAVAQIGDLLDPKITCGDFEDAPHSVAVLAS